MLVVNQEPYLLVATDVEPVARYIEYPLYRISEVRFLPYRRQRYQPPAGTDEDAKVLEELGRNYLNRHFYFSYKEIITSSLAQQQLNPPNIDTQFNEFAWNGRML